MRTARDKINLTERYDLQDASPFNVAVAAGIIFQSEFRGLNFEGGRHEGGRHSLSFFFKLI